MREVLRIRDFRYVAIGQFLSSVGDWFMLLAVPYFVLQLTGSTVASGLALATETVPALLLSPVAGVLVDRWDRRSVMIVTNLARAVAVSSMLFVRHSSQVWVIYLALLLEASFSQLFNPARQALTPALVGRGPLLRSANSLNALIGGVVRLVGAPLGGALYALLGFAPIVWIDTASYVIAAICLGLIAYRPPKADQAVTSEPTVRFASFVRSVNEGLAFVRSTPGFAALFTAGGLAAIGNSTLTVLLVPYVSVVLDATARTLGILFAFFGAGFVIGAPVARRLGNKLPDRVLLTGSFLALALAFLATFNIHSTRVDAVLFTFIGISAICAFVTVDTLLQSNTPDDILGRVSASYATVQAAAAIIGGFGGAALSGVVGVVPAMNIATALVFLASVAALFVRDGSFVAGGKTPQQGNLGEEPEGSLRRAVSADGDAEESARNRNDTGGGKASR
jgi:predicted MFS family arabinose efflux permease